MLQQGILECVQQGIERSYTLWFCLSILCPGCSCGGLRKAGVGVKQCFSAASGLLLGDVAGWSQKAWGSCLKLHFLKYAFWGEKAFPQFLWPYARELPYWAGSRALRRPSESVS